MHHNKNSQHNILTVTAIIGIMFMISNTAALAIPDIASKVLRSELSSGFIVFLYKFGLLIVTLPWVFYNGTEYIKTKRIHFHILRSFFGTIGIMSFVQGLKYITMVSAAAFENVQYIIVVLLGVFIFNDKLTKTKITAIISGFIGACIIVNPGFIRNLFDNCDNKITDDHDIAKYGYTILAISCWAVNSIIVKTLGNTEHNKTQMFYLLLFASIWSFPAAFIKWNNINLLGNLMPLSPAFFDPGIAKLTYQHILLLALMGICYSIHGIAYFNALKHDLSIVIPFRYTKLIFSGFLGYALFNEDIDGYSLIGYFLVICSSFMLIRYEVRKRRKNKINKLS